MDKRASNAEFKRDLTEALDQLAVALERLRGLGSLYDNSSAERDRGYSMATIVALNLAPETLKPIRRFVERMRANLELLDRKD